MKMTFRWYGSQADPIPLKYIKQIPGMTGLMGLLVRPAGVAWETEDIKALVDEVHAAGLEDVYKRQVRRSGQRPGQPGLAG